MTQLMIQISRLCNSDSGKNNKESYLFNIFQYTRVEILNNLNHNWTAESMAALTNFGTSQFYQYYQTFFGISPKSELIDARIAHAKNLMLNEKNTITEAALKSGFQTPSHFARYFKKKTTMTPQEWVHSYNAARLP